MVNSEKRQRTIS